MKMPCVCQDEGTVRLERSDLSLHYRFYRCHR